MTEGPLAGYRLLAVVAHPDDEAWALGGTIAGCSVYGCRTDVLFATRGEAGVDVRGATAPGTALAALRTAEAEASCDALGARAHFGDLPDGGLAGRRADGVALVRRFVQTLAPHVVLTLGDDGGYGHEDHFAVTDWCREAVGAGPARLLEAALPPDLLRPLWRRLRNAGFAGVRAGMQTFGVPRDRTGLQLDVSRWAPMKRAAVAAHGSQFRGEDVDAFLLPGLVSALADEECFVCTAGAPLPPDAQFPFEGLER